MREAYTFQENSQTGNTEINFTAQSNYNKYATVEYSYTDAQNGDISITNTYTPSTTSVTITKEVKGNMGDRSKEFEFTASLIGSDDVDVSFTGITVDGEFTLSDDSMTATFPLAHDGSITLAGITIGSDLYLKEDNGPYIVEVMVGTEAINPYDGWYIIDVDSSDVITVAVTNTYNAIIDTAVHLDYLPYIILFAIVGTGVIIAASDKRREADE